VLLQKDTAADIRSALPCEGICGMKANLTTGDERPHRWPLLRRGVAFVTMLGLAMAYRAPHLTDWDAWDYAAQAIQGQSSDLLLGRWWFVAAMRAAYLVGRALFGLSALDGYLAMQFACALFMAAAVAAGMAWTFRLTRSSTAEGFFALVWIPGLLVGVYGSAVMTEGLALLMIACSFLAWESAMRRRQGGVGLALVAGACFGIAVDVREPAAILCAWPIASCFVDRPRRRWRLLGAALVAAVATLGLGVAMAWAWYPSEWTGRSYWHNLSQWTAWMSLERGRFGVAAAAQLWLLVQYTAAASAAVLILLVPSAVWCVLRHRRLRWLLLASLPYVIMLALNHNLSVNPRFVLPAVWMWLPVIAAALAAAVRKRGRESFSRLLAACGLVVAAHATLLVAGWGMLRHYYFDYAASQRHLYRVMLRMPDDAMVIAGPGTPAAHYLLRLGEKHFAIVGSGWGWPPTPDELADRIDAALAEGREVYANLDEVDWSRVPRDSGEWEMLFAVAVRYRISNREGLWPMVQLLPWAPPPLLPESLGPTAARK
jgi:hypothetical protein